MKTEAICTAWTQTRSDVGIFGSESFLFQNRCVKEDWFLVCAFLFFTDRQLLQLCSHMSMASGAQQGSPGRGEWVVGTGAIWKSAAHREGTRGQAFLCTSVLQLLSTAG